MRALGKGGIEIMDDTFITTSAGVRMPRLLYGTAWKKERTETLVSAALRAGFRGIDTACQPKHYHEPGVGDAIAAALGEGMSRADLYIQTKFTPLGGQDPQRLPYDPKAGHAEQVAQSFRASLRNLRVDHLDGLVLHSPLPAEELREVWSAMEAIVDAGGARQLGISNCYDADYLEALYNSSRIKPAVVQNRFYAETGYDGQIRAFCRRHGIIYQSFWTLTANPQLLGSREILAIASHHQRTPAQVLFRYLSQQAVVPLTGTSSEVHMREDLAIFEFELSEAECTTIEDLL